MFTQYRNARDKKPYQNTLRTKVNHYYLTHKEERQKPVVQTTTHNSSSFRNSISFSSTNLRKEDQEQTMQRLKEERIGCSANTLGDYEMLADDQTTLYESKESFMQMQPSDLIPIRASINQIMFQ